MKLLELFSGIGGFALGFQQAGFEFEKHYFSEIDKHAIANYTHNFKNAEYVGAVQDVRGIKADIITFGSPCQDFSLAGKREGINGKRSGLIREAIRIIDEVRPDIFIWENVKGAYSTNEGRDFQAVLREFANIGGYRLEWQLLNTKWFLPQNRERIYLIGHLAGRSEPGVFPIGDSRKTFSKRLQKKQGEREWFQSVNCASTITNPTRESNTDTYVADYRHDVGLRVRKDGICPTIPAQARTDYRNGAALLITKTNIRRLTEVECERLQGFPDDWTRYGNYNGEIKEIAKTNRYKLIGNAVTVDVVQAIAKRLK